MGELTTVVLVVAVAAAILLAVLAGILVVRRTGERRLQSRLGALDRQLASLSEGIGAVVERAEAERRRELLGDLGQAIGTTLNLRSVLQQAVEATASLAGADAAVAIVRVPEQEPAVEARGVPAEVAWRTLPVPPVPDDLRSLTVSFDYGDARPEQPFRSATAVPLRVPGSELGHLVVYSYGGADVDADGLAALAARLSPAVRNALELVEANERARTDALTQLRNRGGYDEALALEIARAQRFGRPLSLVVLDLDDFGLVNKELGLQVGDVVLQEFANRVRRIVRATDIPCRRGGEEFAIVLVETTLDRASLVYRRLRSEVALEPFPEIGTRTFSAGLAEYREGDTPASLDERAAGLMKDAKEQGKNRCVTERGDVIDG